jgi:protein-S-isoprenylcysteine O-methyltransferase Ste14
MLAVRAVFFAALLPGTVTIVVPWWLRTSMVARFDIDGLRFTGIALVALGAAGLIWCIVDFARQGRGTLAPIDAPRFLVRGGLYRRVRNPMYVSVVTVLAGEALLFERGVYFAWAAIVAALFHAFVVFYEEPTLHRKFGDSYDAYRRQVPGWLPRRPPKP